ncbi:MAG: hypothetical protein LBQ65_07230, partial [Tannerellaceae bacterium]|nr:hypothetical protein [Tannerellaceae bacterium]
DWLQYEQNPILAGGGIWKCSGHGTLVQTPDQRYFYLYHAYHAYDFEFVGRQGLLDELRWDEKTGWPYFRYGALPSVQAALPFQGTSQQKTSRFYDNFTQDESDLHWLWDMNLSKPLLSKKDGVLSLTAPQAGLCFRGVNPQSGNYSMETSVAVNEAANLKGLCVYGNPKNLLAWGIAGKHLKLYQWKDNNKTELFSHPLEASKVYLRIVSANARAFRFQWSENGKDWHSYPQAGSAIDGNFLPQWGKGVRAGLLVENNKQNTGSFAYFLIENR